MNIGIIGAGINGICTGIVLAEKGCKVTVYERKTPFSETSSRSSKMLHGGIRYLEKGHIKLVKDALADRAWWMVNCKNMTRISRFYIPVYKGESRSRIKLYVGVKTYEHLAGRLSAGQSNYHSKDETLINNPLLSEKDLVCSVSYMDVQMDDIAISNWLLDCARLLNVDIKSHVHVKKITVKGEIFLEDGQKERYEKVINTAGPWASKILFDSKIESRYGITFVKGSHLIIEKIIENPLVFQVYKDKRIVFMLPHGKMTIIGTTEVEHKTDEEACCSEHEEQYLLQAINSRLKNKIIHEEILEKYAGIRPIVNNKKSIQDYSSANRESIIEVKGNVITVFGGKWTSGIRVGRSVADLLFIK